MAIEIPHRTLTREETLAREQQGKTEADIAAEVIDFENGLLRQIVRMSKHALVKDKTVESLLP